MTFQKVKMIYTRIVFIFLTFRIQCRKETTQLKTKLTLKCLNSILVHFFFFFFCKIGIYTIISSIRPLLLSLNGAKYNFFFFKTRLTVFCGNGRTDNGSRLVYKFGRGYPPRNGETRRDE